MTRFFRLCMALLIGLSILVPQRTVLASQPSQNAIAQENAAVLLEKMTPAEKVGQLFLVTFQGTLTDPSSNIYKLITEQRIGGIVLRADNNNFIGPEGTLPAAQAMIQSLQQVNWEITHSGNPNASTNASTILNYAPLLIGISQEGDLAPYDQILNGLTALPNEMAIGATWDAQNAETVGTILGQELSALGFNLIFGPSLDVLDVVKTDVGEDLGVRTFGGDPYWVAEMGQAYIKGVHTGSNNKIAVIATHFPGRGGSDRQPEDEVATVRKSLEQLKQIELAPFFAVTAGATDAAQITDGLLLSHIRYQGFQGNIRATTKPVSFDSAALDQIMSLEQFSSWEENGGIIVSDDLGSTAVKKFFDPLNTGFDARQVIKSALLAGNDLLYTGNILASGDENTYATIVRTHEFFVQKYNEDSAFKQRVDEAVMRILTLKFKLYPDFRKVDRTTSPNDLDVIGTSEQQIFEIARQSITMISPELGDLDSVLPEPPQYDERIVFISDNTTQQQCSACTQQNFSLAVSLRNAVERLYGPEAGQQIQTYKLSAYSFEELENLLDNNSPPEYMAADIESAKWLVISFTDFQSTSEQATVFHRFFSEQPELTRNKNIIGFAFNAPYYPDATDISKFTAYYAVYSKIPVFIEVAARILFQEIVPAGVLPVSFSSIGYDLITATTPDPNQIIPLRVEPPQNASETTETPVESPTPMTTYQIGDTISLATGVIIDHNGNPVPDGTVVRFLIDTRSPSGTIQQIETQTVDGVARTIYHIDSLGSYELRVAADPAQISQILSLEISDSGGQITSFQPTPMPTETSYNLTQTPEVAPTPDARSLTNHELGIPSSGDWFLSTLIIFLSAGGLYWWGWEKQKYLWNPRIPLLTGCFGYLAYLYYVIGLPGASNSIITNGTGIIIFWVIVGCLSGGAAGYVWYAIERSKNH